MNEKGERFGDRLPWRRLGRSGLIVPAIGLGGATLGHSHPQVTDAQAIAAVHYALEQGITYIDTSPLYGDSERRIGLALQGAPRRTYVLSTKTGTHPARKGDYSWDGTLWSVENSLRLLKTDYFDLLLIHDPVDIEPVFAPRGALEALEYLKGQGVIKNIGLGQRRHDFHRRAIESGRFDVILTFNDHHPLNTSAAGGLLQLAAEHNVGVINGSPMAQGLLAGDPDTMDFSQNKGIGPRQIEAARRFYHWCRERSVSPIAVALQFSLRQPLIHCTLSGAKSKAELEENLRAATTPLPESVWDELPALQASL